MSIFTVATAIVFLLLITRGLAATLEYRRHKQEKPLYIMEDRRRFVLIGRILAGIAMVVIIGLFIYTLIAADSIYDIDFFRPFSLILGLAFFAFVPFSASRWVIQEEGVFVYNNNKFIPWSQLITTGIKKKENKTYIVLQVKKEAGELFKQTFYLLMVNDEDAERLSEMIKQFIRSIDKMKRIKHIQDEKKIPKKKRTWY